MTKVYVRELTDWEVEDVLDRGLTCARCDKIPHLRVVGGGNFRLCVRHGMETQERLARAMGITDE